MTPTFAGEMQLAGWSESHTGGCKVTFWLQSPDDLAAFRALTVRKGNTAGHRFMAALVEIGDDELPVQPTPIAGMAIPITRAHIGDACYRTVMWCQDTTFWRFLNTNPSFNGCDEVKNSDQAGDVVRFLCTVDSRKEFDSDNEANKRWHRIIREPYRLYLARINQ